MNTRVSAKTAAPGYRIDITSGGHALVADEPADLGGANAGATPFGLVLAGLAACTGITLRMYGRRKGWPDLGLSIDLELMPSKERHADFHQSTLPWGRITVRLGTQILQAGALLCNSDAHNSNQGRSPKEQP